MNNIINKFYYTKCKLISKYYTILKENNISDYYIIKINCISE